MPNLDRRGFLKRSALATSAAALPFSLVEVAFAQTAENFTFAYISDAHIEHVERSCFVRSRDEGLRHAVREINQMR
ncbi:MAG TPA: twin-arginine translocation signal domain-containing protein, partial [Phenylobacterium sp.]|uniref:twin-arginine translocation signal domain-containing protein n=1 Tax=Phenylobacterium sp. TaxID=1871053 RepID=UPI002B46A094